MDAIIIIIAVLWAVFGASSKKKKPAAGGRLRDLRGQPAAQDGQPASSAERRSKPVTAEAPQRRSAAPATPPTPPTSPAPAAPEPAPAAPSDLPPAPERRQFFYTQADYDGRAAECPACTPEETPDEEREAALTFDFSANEIVRGFVYSEIFGNRPGAEEREWTPFAR